jgi:glycosyltransferase involved in cell wall biosynthesis
VRVLVVSHLYPSPGVERHLFVHEQNRALQALGVEIRVVSPTPYAPRLLWRDPRQRRRGQKPRHAVRDGIAADYPRVPQLPRHLLFDRLGDLAYPFVRRAAAVRDGVDLVHAHQALPDGAVAQRLAAELGVPYLVTVHGADVYQHLRRGDAVGRRAAAVLGGAAVVMANSGAVARLLADVVPSQRLRVVLNGTTGLDVTVPAADDVYPGEPLLLTVGYLIERKGHAVVLEALVLLAQQGLRPHWLIVGEGVLREQLASQAASLGLAETVHFLGRQPHRRVLELMARAELFVLPSWDEAFGLVYTEAMMQETPVVACRGEGPEDFVEDGVSGYLVPARDPRSLADVVAAVQADPAAAAAVGAAGRASAAALTWTRNARLTLAAYEQALARGAAKEAS